MQIPLTASVTVPDGVLVQELQGESVLLNVNTEHSRQISPYYQPSFFYSENGGSDFGAGGRENCRKLQSWRTVYGPGQVC